MILRCCSRSHLVGTAKAPGPGLGRWSGLCPIVMVTADCHQRVFRSSGIGLDFPCTHAERTYSSKSKGHACF
ncbi:hypothetical protein SKAU_G00102350 [Synaphobranchus kaupii]|uniref:Uncharacterized protein n=1 Tax=Synaphobranchus kaupii TaxID=118154 RepID=A0A9Q1FZF8_SYNKA|nr:hypothetical protein SKAU_G00102350 [Synaphobranchus kaupii]